MSTRLFSSVLVAAAAWLGVSTTKLLVPSAPAATSAAVSDAAAPAAGPVAAAPDDPPPPVLSDAPPAPDAAAPAEPPVPAAPAADTAASAAPTAAPSAPEAPAKSKDTLSVDFPDEDIRNILRNVADLFELNIIMPETLQGKTTIKLRDVTWRQIFQSVLDPVGYTYVEDGNIIKIVTKESLAEEPVTTEVFIINYARAADILPTISSLVDTTRGRIVVDARTNSLVITERPTRLSRIRPIIQQLDRATDQVMIESKFVEVSDTDIKNIGVNWVSLQQGFGATAGNLTSTFSRSRTRDANIGYRTSNDVANNAASRNADELQTRTGATQTTGSGTNNSISTTNGTPTNVSSTNTNSSLTNTFNSERVVTNTGETVNQNNVAQQFLNDLSNLVTDNREVTALLSADEFRVVLTALQSTGDVKIVSNPTVVTLNNTEATINVGDSQPIPNYAFNAQTGSFEVNGFSYKDIGIILKVTPQVNAAGFIKLILAPEVSQQNGVRRFGEAELPIIATRKAVTQVSLKDGFTMGIGGLLSTQTTKGVTKVPLLGSVPVLGRLFRSDNHDIRTTNLIIFITAKTVSADGAPVEQVFDPARVRQLGLRREDLPGYRDGSSPYVTEPPPPAKSRGRADESGKRK